MNLLIELCSLLPVVERDLEKVRRWTNYQTSSGSRSQTTLAHTASIQLVAQVVLEAERRHGIHEIDAAMVLGALAVHDIGEVVCAEIGHDVVYDQKTAASDAEELVAFNKLIETFPAHLRDMFLDHFLLQFVDKNTNFDEKSRERIERLSTENRTEAAIFEAVERMDYLLYALHEYNTKGNLRILVHTLRRSHEKLRALSEILPGFATIYDSEVTLWAERHLENYKGVTEEMIPDRGPDLQKTTPRVQPLEKPATHSDK